MFSAEALRDLFRHMEWADATVWAAALSPELGDARSAGPTRYLKTRAGVDQESGRRPPAIPNGIQTLVGTFLGTVSGSGMN